jgi:hypothetical protein
MPFIMSLIKPIAINCIYEFLMRKPRPRVEIWCI